MNSHGMNQVDKSSKPALAETVAAIALRPTSWLILLMMAVVGCTPTSQELAHSIIMPEQRTIPYRDPAPLPPARIPDTVSPRTVTNPQPETKEWQLSLDEAIRIALENGQVVRVLAGTSATSSGLTIYDAAITNTTIDTAEARFDPSFQQNNLWGRTNTPSATIDPTNFFQSLITSTPIDSYTSTVGLTKNNVFGGQLGLTYIENPVIFPGHSGLASGALGNSANLGTSSSFFPLNPQQTHTLQLGYTQPLLQGAGFAVNVAPIVIARLNTEQSYFQYKDGVQSTVLGVITAYWNLVQSRTVVWARKIQVELSEETFKREQARLLTGLGNRGNEAQARVTYYQFKANLIAAEADVLTQEDALRNIMGIPPSDGRRIVPTSAPAEQRLAPDWNALVHLAEERRPDIVELKIIVEADKERIIQAENQFLPQLNAVANYQFNGLSGTMLNGDKLSTGAGQFNNWSVGLNFSVPLGLRAERANLRQQKLLITRDTDNVQQGIHAAVHQLASTIRDLDSAYDQFLAFKDVRTAAYDNLLVQIGNERVGFINYLNVLQSLNDWGNAVSTEAQQLLAYNISLATLERETGTILETHGLVFNEERFRAAGPIPCHDRLYPEAVVPTGTPRFAPGTDQPSEEVFDLKKPDWRNARPEAPGSKPPAGDPLPAPRPVPMPDKIQPISANTWAADKQTTPASKQTTQADKQPVTADKQPASKPRSAPALLGPPERFSDLLEWPPPARPASSSNANP